MANLESTGRKPFRIAVAGLGTVGASVLQIVAASGPMLAQRAGRELKITAISARDPAKRRGFDASAYRWESDPLALASADDVDLVVEAMGGAEGTALELTRAALAAGKAVVTANKAMIAAHGLELAELSEKHGAPLMFEAAVAGGIPVLKTLREGLAANSITRVVGILNGTSNFILTAMQKQGWGFEEALAEATRLGYAEADPSFDVDGIDTAQKLGILSAIAFGCLPDAGHVHCEGIRQVTALDMQFAAELGFNIKLLGIAAITDQGIEQRVHPCMLPKDSPVGVDDVFNAIVLEGDAVGRVTLEGRGAGGGPTASAVIADIVDIARGSVQPPFGLRASQLQDLPKAEMDALHSAFYLRLGVIDRPGVLADVTRIFYEHGISMRSFLQHSHAPGEPVQLVLTTHRAEEAAMRNALQAVAALDSVTDTPHLIRMEPNL